MGAHRNVSGKRHPVTWKEVARFSGSHEMEKKEKSPQLIFMSCEKTRLQRNKTDNKEMDMEEMER